MKTYKDIKRHHVEPVRVCVHRTPSHAIWCKAVKHSSNSRWTLHTTDFILDIKIQPQWIRTRSRRDAARLFFHRIFTVSFAISSPLLPEPVLVKLDRVLSDICFVQLVGRRVFLSDAFGHVKCRDAFRSQYCDYANPFPRYEHDELNAYRNIKIRMYKKWCFSKYLTY